MNINFRLIYPNLFLLGFLQFLISCGNSEPVFEARSLVTDFTVSPGNDTQKYLLSFTAVDSICPNTIEQTTNLRYETAVVTFTGNNSELLEAAFSLQNNNTIPSSFIQTSKKPGEQRIELDISNMQNLNAINCLLAFQMSLSQQGVTPISGELILEGQATSIGQNKNVAIFAKIQEIP